MHVNSASGDFWRPQRMSIYEHVLSNPTVGQIDSRTFNPKPPKSVMPECCESQGGETSRIDCFRCSSRHSGLIQCRHRVDGIVEPADCILCPLDNSPYPSQSLFHPATSFPWCHRKCDLALSNASPSRFPGPEPILVRHRLAPRQPCSWDQDPIPILIYPR